MVLTVFGRAPTKCLMENGRYRRTLSTPIFSPLARAHSTYSWVVSAPEPMMIMTFSASGAPK